MNAVERPWGKKELISEIGAYKIYKIIVDPNHRTSLHFHTSKNEIIIYLSGDLSDCVLNIPAGTVHRINGPALLIEISNGEESDVTRLEDDYARK
ncbi:MAG: Mannose-6-phosphate isomerase [Methanosaeta sp. PtaB.Bin039]|nr:MAG: Mannose-6-phosphate isomerase [Methanosaeta sp. PtaB.Bin039]